MEKPKRMGDGLRSMLERWGLEGIWQASEVKDAFVKVFSAYPGTEFIEFDKGKLTVGVRSAALRSDLSFRKKELISVMNEFIGEEMVKEIKLTGIRCKKEEK
ncbi:MAG: DciA family protein [candidate division WOR-3 bacterium]